MRSWARGVVAEVRSLGRLYLYVKCRYAADGVEHEVEEVRVGLLPDGRFAAGEAVDVRYSPSDPGRAGGLVAVGLSASMLIV